MKEDPLYILLGDRIRDARQRKHISQKVLAGLLGMNRTSIVNIEQGRQHPPLRVIWEIAEKLGTEASALIPKRHELLASTEPVNLDQSTLDKINFKAAGDLETRRKLQSFVQWVKTQSK